MTIILGLNAYHGDAAACILVHGRLIAAVEEERFRRIKHWAGFPQLSIEYCLEEAGVRLADIEHVAINSNPKANLLKKLGFVVRRRPELRLLLDRARNAQERGSVQDELARAFPGQRFAGEVHRVEHHEAHLASTYYPSPFSDAAVVSVDGFGDFSSMAWGTGHAGHIEVEARTYFPHSLGIFYQALTQYLGFPNYGDEYKVMGLAPYGKPTYLDAMRRVVRLLPQGQFELDLQYFRHHREEISYEWSGGSPSISELYTPALGELLGPARRRDEPLTDHHRDLAHSIQAMYEEAFFHLLAHVHHHTGLTDVTLAGGCAMNSVANGKVRRRSPFKRVYIQSAAGDAGGAIGAALHVKAALGDRTPCPMTHAYWGPGYDTADIQRTLEEHEQALHAAHCSVTVEQQEAALCQRVAQAIADGKVIGWFQGRMEWGPRALGNRSILGDPRRADMKDILNLKIKRRESFRPFAPSILRNEVDAWFEEEDDVPFMMKVFQIRAEQRPRIPAVAHVDGSGRLQTVTQEDNPLYYRLIDAFRELTGVPILLNTSFNENEPVVCRPAEAIACFLRTKMDMLVLGQHICERKETLDPKE